MSWFFHCFQCCLLSFPVFFWVSSEILRGPWGCWRYSGGYAGLAFLRLCGGYVETMLEGPKVHSLGGTAWAWVLYWDGCCCVLSLVLPCLWGTEAVWEGASLALIVLRWTLSILTYVSLSLLNYLPIIRYAILIHDSTQNFEMWQWLWEWP